MTALLHNKFLSKILILFAALLSITMAGQTTLPYTASGNFTVPAGSTTITVKAWGGGGGGGGSTTAVLTRRGGGGGGGAYANYTFTGLTSSLTFPIVIGKGGDGGNGNYGDNRSNGINGDFSTITGFENFIKAAGGIGGTANISGG